ncbi:ABC transporter ATP-binding protein [Desulfitobacterium chlororespirans]|uniref:Amino acid/amide ABC transporter ATP-binding protein 2, HAAT family n=1 Tax=Desulfitobacterium chlororespirans DSM 11544 TaxID=1121395 RepID=A0A1M7UG98_9FIRM|nr:ABC transporter ATP-binding protein [Desulfitobacterium chlororespirans]SHN81940.1 amino acid/amide ABC transporter ATP-binding protein 2, HAAT family [Desulfitobacterium chlororespirans DSM 11544]
MLNLSNVDVMYGKFVAVKNVSMRVNEGEIVALIGSNGAGKSTLLKSISGLCTDLNGEIVFKDEKMRCCKCHEKISRGIVHVPEGRKLFPKLTVMENLQMGAYSKCARKEAKNTIKRVFELFPRLEERKHQLAGSMSGGEQQMCAIGRGMMGLPKLLLLDEPSLGLAPKLVKTVFETIKKINDDGITILLAEQNTTMSLKYSDRFYILENGTIVNEQSKDSMADDSAIREKYFGLV